MRVCHIDREFSRAELQASAASLGARLKGLDSRARFAVHVPDGPLTASALAFSSASAYRIALLHAELTPEAALPLAAGIGCQHIISGVYTDKAEWTVQAVSRADESGRDVPISESVCLLTSGTTAAPKVIPHSWESLKTSVKRAESSQSGRWLSLYPLTRFAGLNTLLHAMVNDATLILPEVLTPSGIIAALQRWKPTHISGTPTLWRSLLLHLPREAGIRESVRQITLGGETVDQMILNALAAAFPMARVTHIYATTEMGICFSVSDGRAGFPANLLERPGRVVEMEVRDGQLYVRRPGRNTSAIVTDEFGWWCTGDLVDVRDNRVFFQGRKTEVLNIGGAKVSPMSVEAALCAVGGVADARVSGKANSFSGTLLTAKIIASAGVDQQELRHRIYAHCRKELPAYAVPRIVEFVTELPVSTSGKAVR